MPAAIRPARATDINALAAMEDAVFEGDRLSRRSFRRLIGRDSAVLLVAGAGGSLTGYSLVLFRVRNTVARLYSIATAPTTERSGTGRLLLDAAENAARQRGCTLMRLEVRQDNARALRLYEQNGYRRIGTKPGYYEDGATALRYEKRLDESMPAESKATAGRRAAR